MSKQVVKPKSVVSKEIQESKISKKNIRAPKKPLWEFPLNRQNLIWLAIGIAVILVGYGLMATGISEEPALVEGTWNNPLAVTIAPLLLVIGYCVIIPIAILKSFKKKEGNNE